MTTPAPGGRALVAALACIALTAFLPPSAGPPAPLVAESHVPQTWLRSGTGMVTGLALAATPDGGNDLLVGGRGVGRLDESSFGTGAYAWTSKWTDADGDRVSSDGEVAQQLVAADLDGDGVDDILAGADRGLFAIDGATGATRWWVNDAAEGNTNGGAHELAVGDLDGDGLADAAFAELLDDGVTAVRGTDGARLWRYARPLGYVQGMAADDLNGDGFTDVLVIGLSETSIEVHAISGLGAAVTGTALPLWVQTFPAAPALVSGGAPTSLDIGQVVAGGTPEVIVGGNGAIAVLDGRLGLPLAQWQVGDGKTAGHVAAVDVDGDGDDEIAAALVLPAAENTQTSIALYEGDGATRWGVGVPMPVAALQAHDLDADGDDELVASGGWMRFGGVSDQDGFVTALEGDGADLWTQLLPEAANALLVGEVFSEPTVVVGQSASMGDGSGVHAFGYDGAPLWMHRTGGRISDVTAGDVDLDGTLEVVEAADDATVAAHDADGHTRWSTRLPGQGSPDVTAVAVGDLQAAPGADVVAGTLEYAPNGPRGRVHVLDADGELRWSRGLGGAARQVDVVDLDRDGEREILALAGSASIDTAIGVIGRYRADGSVIWERQHDVGQDTSLAFLDVTRDGTDDLIVRKSSVFHGGAVFLVDGATGAQLWRVDLANSVGWLDVEPHGIAIGDFAGTVRYLSLAVGGTVWEARPGSASWGGSWAGDATGDGIPDVLSASHEGNVRLLDGRDGTVVWTAPTDDDLPGHRAEVVHGANGPVVLAGTFGQGTYSRAQLLQLDITTGERTAVTPTSGPVLDLHVVDLDGDGIEEAVAADGWQLRLLTPGR